MYKIATTTRFKFIAVLAIVFAVAFSTTLLRSTNADSPINLISNPSLESGTTIPSDWFKGGFGTNNRALTYSTTAHTGTKAVKVEMTSYTNGDAKWYFQYVPVTPGQSYTFSDWEMSSVSSYVTVQFKLADGTFKYLDIARPVASPSGWQNIQSTFIVPANVASLTVFHLINQAGYIITDDYSLTVITPPTPTPTASPTPSATATPTPSATPTPTPSPSDTPTPTPTPTDTPTPTPTPSPSPTPSTTPSPSPTPSPSTTPSPSPTPSPTPTPTPTGRITVNVSVINNNNGTKQVSDFPLFVDAENVANGVSEAFDIGSHTISEITDPNYTTQISGDCDQHGNLILSAGDNKTCTITNDDIPPVPPITPINLVSNPSVETASSNPSVPSSWLKGGSGTNTRVLTYPVAGYDGDKAIRTEITNYTSGDAKWYFQAIQVSGGQKYTFSDYYKSNTTSYLTAQYQLQDGTFKYPDLAVNLPASPTAWTQVSRSFNIPTNYPSPVVSITIFHLIKSVGWINTDSYSLTTYVPPPVDPDNIINNASLEIASDTSPSIPAAWTKATSAGSTATFSYPVTGYDGLSAVRVDISSYTSGAGAKWYFQSVPVTPGSDYVFSDYYKSTQNSSITVQLKLNDDTYKYIDLVHLTPSADWKKAQNTFTVPENVVSLTVIHLIQGIGSLTTDKFTLKKLPPGNFSNGMISFNFDDGPISVYNNALPLLNQAGIHSSQYIITTFFNDEGHVNQSQVIEMANDGHEIGDHTRTHPHLTQLDQTQLNSEIIGSKNDLIALGLNPTVFVYPYGDYNDKVEQTVIDAGYVGARSVRSGFNTKNINPYELMDQHIESHVTIDQVKAWVDKAMADKTWLILEIHDIDYSGDTYSVTPEFLQQIIDYVQTTHIPVVTTSEGLSLMRQ